ncbi:hypothetical protein GCM10010329_15230 [Streptomyces spiroverticillatus]|uniref:Uncharacterized protein n=1 Tax=Streptomyces finlayi TaxID=67296 RepID=A0A918X2Z3_9ACTN|nr:hypothetical protein GCM10010329_15230 [Streptomyces spiroverticillatus]GHD07075.1 hypothetical protein GCM10010334_59260 [Streptomyces finlayi]
MALTACGTETLSAESPPADWAPRMRAVAKAWEGSAALTAMQRGFHPLARFRTTVPPGGLRSAADRTAHLKGAYVVAGELPDTRPQPRATWPDGTTRKAATLTAREAVEFLGEGSNDPDGGHTLKVTGARLGTTEVATSRGPTRVPAWLFTVAGYDAPFTYPALAAPTFPDSPIAPLPRLYGADAAATGGPGSVTVEGRTLTVTVTHGSCTGPSAVKALESGDTVVLAVSVLPRKRPRGPDEGCDLALRHSRATVELARPVGDRILLEAQQGIPVQQSLD